MKDLRRGIGSLVLSLAALSSCGAEEQAVTYQTTKAGVVSLGIYDEAGRLVRTLQNGKKQQPGQYQVTWDGKDDRGQGAKPGKYQLRGVVSSIKATYELTAGNPGDPPYTTADGKGAWNSHWGDPVALAADETGLYIQFSMEEGCGSLLKVSFDGKVQWKAHLFQGDGNGFQLAAATDGKHVYVAADVGASNDLVGMQRRAVVWRVDTAEGNYALWNGHGLAVGRPYDSGPVPFWEVINGDRKTPPVVLGTNGGANVRGLAVRGGKLYVPLYRENVIEVWDTESGKLLSTIAEVQKPQGVAADERGNLYVASGQTIAKFSPSGQNLGVAVEKNLSAPYGVAVDAKGNLYVTDLGDSQQVKKFSPSGKLLWALGKKGGRPFSGKMDHGSFLFPAGLAVDLRGSVYVGENSPPSRVTVLNANGRIAEEWIGSLAVGAGLGIAVDEADPSLAYSLYSRMNYCGDNYPLVRYRIDYQRKTWSVDAYWWGLAGASGYPRRGSMAFVNPRVIAWGNSDLLVRHRGGRTYLFFGVHWNHPIWRLDGYSLVASACIGQGDRMLPTDLDKSYTFDEKGNPITRNTMLPFIWRDANGDGQAGSDEVQFFDDPKGLGGHGSWGAYMDEHMTVYLPDEMGTGNVYKLPCLGLDPKGNPIYSWAKAEVLIPAKNALLAECEWTRAEPWAKDKAGQVYRKEVERVKVDEAGNIYGTTEIMGQDKGIGWASSTVEVKVGKWDAQGNLLWRTGTKATAFAKPGQFYTGKGVDGILRGFVFFTDENGQARIYTDDGLYAGSVPASDPYRGQAVGQDAILVELCGARVFTHPRTGVDYYMAGDENGLRFYRLEGLKEVERVQAAVEVK